MTSTPRFFIHDFPSPVFFGRYRKRQGGKYKKRNQSFHCFVHIESAAKLTHLLFRNEKEIWTKARNLFAALGCGANAVFSSFGSIKGVQDAVRKEARALYQRRVSAGFSLNPPFKGFGMALLWFALDEPELYSLIMDASEPSASFEEYVDSHIGFKAESLSAIAATFGLKGHNAEMLYYQLVLVALGLASACTCGRSPLSIPQVSEILGKNVRAFLMVIRAGADEREKYVPDAGAGPGGESAPSPAISRMMSGENWNACSAIPSTLHPNLSAKRIPA